MNKPHERLRHARICAGYSDAVGAARAFNWNEITYRMHENGLRGLRIETAQKYAKAFHVSAGWLMIGEGEKNISSESTSPYIQNKHHKISAIPIIDKIEAANFKPTDSRQDNIRVVDEIDSEFPQARQIAFVFEGEPSNQSYPPIFSGAILICIEYQKKKMPILEGMIVIVEQENNVNNKYERSIKEVYFDGEYIIFLPRSGSKNCTHIYVEKNSKFENSKYFRIIAIVRKVVYNLAKNKQL